MNINLTSDTNSLLKEKNIIFKKATEEETNDIYQLFLERRIWFAENKIEQWSDTFFHKFTLEALKDIINTENYFILIKDSNIIAGFELTTDSTYWYDNVTPAYYIHKLVTKTNYKNIGSLIFVICKELARNNKKKFLRLDCLQENEKLNSIYENHGFKLIKTGTKGYYNYSLREMSLNE